MMLRADASALRKDAIGTLLRAIDGRDLHEMETSVEALRGCLRIPGGGPSLDAEQVEALDGLAEEIERSLRRMRAAAAGEMARIRAAAPLLAHVGLNLPATLSQQ